MSDKRFRIGYSYTFLAFPVFEYKGELIGGLSLDVLFKAYDKNGCEITFEDNSDHELCIYEGFPLYAFQLLRCSADAGQLVIELNSSFQQLFGKVDFEVVSHYKELVGIHNGYCYLEPTEISEEEFNAILKENFSKFDNRTNITAQSLSYFTEEVK